MKRLALIVLGASLIGMGCSKKNEVMPSLIPTNAKAADLAGKWVITADTLFSNTSAQYVVNTVTGSPYLEFTAAGNWTIGSDTETPTAFFTFTLTNGTLVLNDPYASTGNGIYATYTIYAITKTNIGLRYDKGNTTHEDAWLTKQ